jgi:hypothetical protein
MFTNISEKPSLLRSALLRLEHYPITTLHEMEVSHLMSRWDEKYLFPAARLNFLLDQLQPFYKVLTVNQHRISKYENIYFDTRTLRCYHDHHNGRAHRFKIRYRRYSDSGDCYFEVKRKTNRGITVKKRQAAASLGHEIGSEQAAFLAQQLGELKEPFFPTLSNSFYRITLVNLLHRERVTVDILLEFSNQSREKNLSTIVVAEVKQEHHDYDSAFKQLMQQQRIFPLSFSKYCIGTLLTCPGIKYNRFKPKLTLLNKFMNEPA